MQQVERLAFLQFIYLELIIAPPTSSTIISASLTVQIALML